MDAQPKKLFWLGSSKRDLMAMPEAVQDTFGFGLHLAQTGSNSDQVKPLSGFGGAGVFEVVESEGVALSGLCTP